MKVIDRLPFSEGPSVVSTPDGIAEVKPFQIVVMVSLAPRGSFDLPPGSPRFPAILDTGMNHNFSIRKEHFDRWARLYLRQRGRVRMRGSELPLLAGSVWLYPNRRAARESSGAAPVRLELHEGLIVYPADTSNPARLPIVGLRALVRNDLKLIIDGKRRHITLKTPAWF